MFKAIPKRLLIHSIDYYRYKEDNFEGEDFEAPIRIDFVRVEPKTRLYRTASGDVVESNTIVFVDALNSTPVEWISKSKIVFRGKELRIVDIAECFAGTLNVHHWELFCL